MEINTRSQDQLIQYQDRKLVRALQGGTEAMRQGGSEFLHREEGESETTFNERLKSVFLTNFVDEYVQVMVGRALKKKINTDIDAKHQETLDQIITDIDANGCDIKQFCRDLMSTGLWNGWGLLIVDKKKDRDLPYFNLIHPDSVLGAEITGGELTLLRIQEWARVRKSRFEYVTTERVRVFEKDGDSVIWELWQKDPDGGDFSLIDSGTVGTSYIPAVAFYAGKRKAAYNAKPPMQPMAELNLQHYQKSNELSNILSVACIPILYANAGEGAEAPLDIKIGVSQAVFANSSSADLRYIEMTGSATDRVQNFIDRTEAQMQYLGMDFLAISQSATATGAALSADGNSSKLAAIVTNMCNALSVALRYAFDLMAIDTDVVVKMDTNYGIKITAEELQALHTARANGSLSATAYLRELKRRGLLAETFDFEQNSDELEQEIL